MDRNDQFTTVRVPTIKPNPNVRVSVCFTPNCTLYKLSVLTVRQIVITRELHHHYSGSKSLVHKNKNPWTGTADLERTCFVWKLSLINAAVVTTVNDRLSATALLKNLMVKDAALTLTVVLISKKSKGRRHTLNSLSFAEVL